MQTINKGRLTDSSTFFCSKEISLLYFITDKMQVQSQFQDLLNEDYYIFFIDGRVSILVEVCHQQPEFLVAWVDIQVLFQKFDEFQEVHGRP